MAVLTRTIEVETKGNGEVVDITDAVAEAIAKGPVSAGTVTVFVKHTTASITLIEMEPGLLHDFADFWARVAPESLSYRHHEVAGERNGHSHVRASTLGFSVVVPFAERRMTLGIWQRVVLVDFDVTRRRRQIVLQVMGE